MFFFKFYFVILEEEIRNIENIFSPNDGQKIMYSYASMHELNISTNHKIYQKVFFRTRK